MCLSRNFARTRNAIHGTAKTCITYDAINAAYLDARKRIRKYRRQISFAQLKMIAVALQRIKIGDFCVVSTWAILDVAQPKDDWKTEDIATVGELLLDISIQLART